MSLFQNKKYHKEQYSEDEILSGIIFNESDVITYIYKKYFSKIKQMVYSFRNTILNPDDVFQEGLTRSVINIREGRFRKESSFYTYFNNICRNICLKELSKIKVVNVEINERIVEDNTIDFEIFNRLIEIKKKLNDNCLKIIDLRFDLETPETNELLIPSACKSFEEIAEKLSLSADNARQRFKRCLDKFRELVFENRELKEYYLQ